MTTLSSTQGEPNIAQPEPDPGSVVAGSKLLGRVAFVTGGTRGIGAAICRSLASQGAAVGAGYSGNDEAAERFREAYRADYPEQGFSVHKGDISNPDDCRRTIQEVVDQHGRLDILVNNAGITADRTVLKMSDDDWRKVTTSTSPAPSTSPRRRCGTCSSGAPAASSTSRR